ncbi:hypothetical protein [Arcanobacterium phocae]|uniref:hypothetical protein n=1 Tax=Arcanobacterium phocae TaxID=131112 RepID=UPI001C0F37AF|nr:hypothetical protein [Arcanobacterium phocae]
MFERPIDYPCAVADQTPEGCAVALKWTVGHLNAGEKLTVWVPQKRTLNANDFLIRLAKRRDIDIVTPREGFYGANGPVLAMYPSSTELGEITSANGITALAIVRWADNFDTWIEEVGAEVVHTFVPDASKINFLPEVEPPLVPEVIEGLQRITQSINHNNSIAGTGYEKDVTVRELLRLHDAGYVLPPKRMAQWASAHGWLHENPKELANWVKKISSGSRPRVS